MTKVWSSRWHEAFQLADTFAAPLSGRSAGDTRSLLVAALQLSPEIRSEYFDNRQFDTPQLTSALMANDKPGLTPLAGGRSRLFRKQKTEYDIAADMFLASMHADLVAGRIVRPSDTPHLVLICLQAGTSASQILESCGLDPGKIRAKMTPTVVMDA